MRPIIRLKTDLPRKTLLEQYWDWKNYRWCRVKIYLPSQKLIAVYSVNRDKLKDPDRINIQNGAYILDDSFFWEEDGIQKAKFVKDGPISMIIDPDEEENGEIVDLEGRQLAVTLKPLTIGHIDAQTFLQRLQTEWGQEMFTESGILSRIRQILGITVLMAAAAAGISLITLLKILTM